MASHPGKTKIGAGLWRAVDRLRGLQRGDIVLCPDGSGAYYVGEVAGNCYHAPDKPLPHRRPVKWLAKTIQRADMTDALKNSTGSIGAVSTITQYAAEIEKLLGDPVAPSLIATAPDVEDPAAGGFAAIAPALEQITFELRGWGLQRLGHTAPGSHLVPH